MLKKQNTATPEKSAGTVIGKGIIVESAILTGNGVIRVDGKFSGTIDIDGHIILGEPGEITGDIHASSALFAGKCEGNMYIKNTLHLASSAQVTGRVETEKMVVDDGAIFNGACSMTNPSGDTPDTSDAADESASTADLLNELLDLGK